MKVYEPAGYGFFWEGDEFANAKYGYDPKSKSVVPLNDRTIMRQVEHVDGVRLVPVVFFGPAVNMNEITIPDECVVVEG